MAPKEKADNENLNRKWHVVVKGTYQKQTGHRCHLFFHPSLSFYCRGKKYAKVGKWLWACLRVWTVRSGRRQVMVTREVIRRDAQVPSREKCREEAEKEHTRSVWRQKDWWQVEKGEEQHNPSFIVFQIFSLCASELNCKRWCIYNYWLTVYVQLRSSATQTEMNCVRAAGFLIT